MKVLVMYASFGSGHRRAAEALVEAFQDRGIAVDQHDLLEFLPAPMSKFYSSAYEFMITSGRRLWHLTYNLVNAPKSPYRPAKARTQKWQFTELKEFLQHTPFTHLISTHFTPSALFTDWRTMDDLHCKMFSVITDHEAHRCWKRTGLDHYFVASEGVASEMHQIGVHQKDITVSGIPISKAFCNPVSRADARKAFNLDSNGTVVLVLCSAVAVKKSIQMLEEFAAFDQQVHYLVVAGSDSAKEQHLKKRFSNDKRFAIFGFSKHIAEMMRASNVIVTKPGGLIVSEAMAAGLPQILLEPIPGQEEANARYAVEKGAAICVIHKRGIYKDTLATILRDSATLLRMRDAARQAGKPRAAATVVETILSSFIV